MLMTMYRNKQLCGGAYNKCEAKTVTALVVCKGHIIDGKKVEEPLETEFVKQIIAKKLTPILEDEDLDLVLTPYDKRDKKQVYDFLFYVSFSSVWLNQTYDDGLFGKLIKDKSAKNVVVCTVKNGINYNGGKIAKIFAGYDVNEFIVSKDIHKSKQVMRVSKDNSFGFNFAFMDRKDQSEDGDPNNKNNEALENLVVFTANADLDTKKPIEYGYIDNKYYRPEEKK
jgi:hypothetical protein